MSDQTPLDVEAIRENIRLYELDDGGDTPAQGEYTDSDLAVRDIRRLLDENARLNAHAENGWGLVETYIKQLETQSAQWGKTLDELNTANAELECLRAEVGEWRRLSAGPALDAAPEMPRPPAEGLAAKLDELQSELDALKARRGALPETGREYLRRMGAEFRSNMARLKARDEAESEVTRLAAQERAGDADMPGTGSGRGTGVAETPGTAQASDG